jgi:murein DD-endopeptidase MepM/ murein hydrolase activator NlpD
LRRRNYSYNRYRREPRGGGGKIWLILLLLILIIAGGVGFFFVTYSPQFEKVPPKIEMEEELFYNPNIPIKVTFKDNYGVGKYSAILSDGIREMEIASGDFKKLVKIANVSLHIPTTNDLDTNQKKWTLTVELHDKSLWNFGQGNSTTKSSKIIVDITPPKVSIIANSPSLTRGGSALVIYKAVDDNFKETHLEVCGRVFKPIKYKKDGYFASLVAWDFRKLNFSAKIIATDTAGNRNETKITFEPIMRRFRKSWIRLSDKFLDGKIAEIAQTDPIASQADDKFQRFRAVNETMRFTNEALIHKYSQDVSEVNFRKWRYLKPFYPLKNAKKVADFGDERHYYYGDKSNEISLSYHLGYDLASIKHDSIYSSNTGEVLFANYNGIYGRMPLIDHGFGLFTIYGHCSEIIVAEGDKVKASEVISKTGKSGLALGDHLHFGILVQGLEVLPSEWMKSNWIRGHITNVFNKADRKIKRAKD